MTTKNDTAPAKVPTPAQVDALIEEFAKAQKEAQAADALAGVAAGVQDEVKGRLVAMVETFGSRHAEKSKRLAGLHHTATTTTGTRTTVDDAAVEKLRAYLGKEDLVQIQGRFFVAHTTYSLVNGPSEVLKTLELGTKIRNKITSLLGLCFKIKTNAPSLKIAIVEGQKP